jgi:hypothetical protein
MSDNRKEEMRMSDEKALSEEVLKRVSGGKLADFITEDHMKELALNLRVRYGKANPDKTVDFMTSLYRQNPTYYSATGCEEDLNQFISVFKDAWAKVC